MRKEYTTAEYRQIVASSIHEKDWMQQVVDTARTLGYLVYHPYDSRRSTPGYLDLSLLRPAPHARFLMIETKTEKGRLTPAQKQWLEGLQAAGIEVYVMRPSDYDRLVEILQRRQEESA